MKAQIARDTCTGCGLCVNSCPDIFEIENDSAVVKVDNVPEDAISCVQEAKDSCPVEAISLE